jgi:hypothetical protein
MKNAGHAYFVGLGLEPREHASVEALVALDECDRVYVHGLDADDLAMLRPFCRKGALTKVPAKAGAAWAKAAAARARKGETVALASLGHPFYAGALGSLLAGACDAAGVAWTSFGAVSPMGVALSEAGVTLGTTVWGLQAFEHRALVALKPLPNPVWPTAIYFLAGADAASARACLRRLEELFPAGHEGLWCSGARRGTRGTLPELFADPGRIQSRAVLFLPAASPASTELGRTGAHSVEGKGPQAPGWIR